jgi:hypothetical protein
MTLIHESMRCYKDRLNQIPNRRFTLWWSPTINRCNVYVRKKDNFEQTII